MSSDRFILRAELTVFSDEKIVSHAYDATDRSVFVVTEATPEIGTELALRLSLPHVLEAIDLVARVEGYKVADGPGEPAGLRLSFAPDARLDAMFTRIATAPSDGSARGFRVLLVEDSSLTRDVFAYGAAKFAPQPSRLALDHAEDAERAWDKLVAGNYDAVIVDHYLPAEDGASLISRLRRTERLADMPVVAISVGGRTARDAAISAGADLFLDKPLSLQHLFCTMEALRQADRGRPHTKKRILVLDDSPLALAVMRAALEAEGFSVAIAEDLSSFERQRVAADPDLILVDVQMPEAFGDDVASTLRGWHAVTVPIVLVSSIEEPELARRAHDAQAAGYICKGAGMTELVRRCRELLGVAS